MTVANRDRSVSVEDFSNIISLDYGSVDGLLQTVVSHRLAA